MKIQGKIWEIAAKYNLEFWRNYDSEADIRWRGNGRLTFCNEDGSVVAVFLKINESGHNPQTFSETFELKVGEWPPSSADAGAGAGAERKERGKCLMQRLT